MDQQQWEAEQSNLTIRAATGILWTPHVSRAHLPMPQVDRAGQFAPFAALTGYKELLDKTAKRYANKGLPEPFQLAVLTKKIKSLVVSALADGQLTCFNGFGHYEATPASWLLLMAPAAASLSRWQVRGNPQFKGN